MSERKSMVNRAYIVLFFLTALCAQPLHALGPILSLFDKDLSDTVQTFSKQVEKHIEDLKKRKTEASASWLNYKNQLEATQKTLAGLKERAQRSRALELEFVNQQLTIANKTVQILNEILQAYEELQGVYDTHIKLLQEYKQDPECKIRGTQLDFAALQQKSIYSIDDFQKITNAVLTVDSELKDLEERLKKSSADYEALRKNLALAKQEYEEKKREQKELKAKTEERSDRRRFTVKQQGELLDAEEHLLLFKKDFAELQLKLADAKAQFVEQNIKITKIHLEVLQKEQERIQQELRVDKKDLAVSETALKNQVQESNRLYKEFTEKIDAVQKSKKTSLSEIQQRKTQLGISETDAEAVSNWTFVPKTLNEWNYIIIGRLHNYPTIELEVIREGLQARIDEARAKVTDQEVSSSIIRTWYNLKTGAFDGYQQEALQKEIQRYEKLKADIQSTIAALEDKRAAAAQMLTLNTRITEAIKALIKTFKEQRDTLFKENPQAMQSIASLLKEEIAGDAQRRAESIAQLIQLVSTIISSHQLTIKKIDSMLEVLKTKTLWKGAPPLIKGLKKFVPELALFINYLFSPKHVSRCVIQVQQTWTQAFKSIASDLYSLLLMLLYGFLLGLIYIVLKLYLADVGDLFQRLVRPEYGIGYILSNFIAVVVNFTACHLKKIGLWTIIFFGVYYQYFDQYSSVIFYLLSIPFWLYLARHFIQNWACVNNTQNELFASKEHAPRFFKVLSVLLYSTVVILFLRQAMLTALPKIDATRVLLALNFVILQISLLFLLGREQLLNLIPRTHPLWDWIYETLNKYYYLFLVSIVFIIVMSNPYIGYGPHFFFAVSRIILIGLLIPFFIVVHNYIKQWLGSFFFYADDEGIKERFKRARSVYGLFVICSFLFFTAVALIIAANIWGYSVGWSDIDAWLHKKIYDFIDSDGRRVVVTALSLMKVLFYTIGGIILASLINRFILHKMFDLLLVNMGIQSVIFSLTRTLIIVLAIIFGLQSIGLSNSLVYIYAVIVGLGVAAKEIISDFIGYFIILIQRPIKVGDQIKIDEDLSGVVRHVSLRSIMLRKNNSVTVIVPNSYVMTKPLTNWNYSRTYFAFDDIKLTVSYTADPMVVKKIIHEVVTSNVNILKNPPPVIRLINFSDNGFEFLIRGFLSPDKVPEQHDIASDIRLELVKTIRARGLDIGSPTRVLRVIKDAEGGAIKALPEDLIE